MHERADRIGHAAAILAILDRVRKLPSLTEEIVRERIEAHVLGIIDIWPAEAGPVIDAFAIVRCDGCGHEHDLLASPLPEGWTTTQSRMGVWTDLCKACSQ